VLHAGLDLNRGRLDRGRTRDRPVGIVPAMFQVPISAPTASRTKMAPTAVLTPPTAASATAAAV
jgi:hypothetical protein